MRNPVSRSLTVALMLMALAACSTDTPTAPQRTPAPPPGSGTPTAWNITVRADPRNLPASDPQPATVTVEVRRAADGTVPQDDTTVLVSATLGELNSSGSGETTATLSLRAGRASLLYFAGSILGTGTIEARLEDSIGSARVNIFEEDILFINSVTPSIGPGRGGTRIRINGTGFKEPLRVTLGPGDNGVSIIASVDAVGEDAQGGFIRAFTGQVVSADEWFLTRACDTDGDGTLDGIRSVPTVVSLNVQLFPSGATDSLPQAFTYEPQDGSCRDEDPDPNPPGRPSADFSFTVNGTLVLFTDESRPTGGIDTWDWLFGDGTRSSNQNPVHNYEDALAPGETKTFTVTLRVINESGEDTTSRDVTVTRPP